MNIYATPTPISADERKANLALAKDGYKFGPGTLLRYEARIQELEAFVESIFKDVAPGMTAQEDEREAKHG